jgi:hypothetical protein
MSVRSASLFLAALLVSTAVLGGAPPPPPPFPTPLDPNLPAGSLIYSGSTSGTISIGETDSFTLSLDAHQTITVDVVPSAPLAPRVEVRDPSNAVIASATAAGVGQEVVLETVPVTTAGTYTISVGGAGASTGAYTLNIILNAALENEGHGGSSDDTFATAQDLGPSAIPLPSTGADRLAAVGSIVSGNRDNYSFTLAAGRNVTIVVKTAAAVDLELFNSSGALEAIGEAGPYNVNRAIRNFAAIGTHFVRLSSSTDSLKDYSLVITPGADFEIEGNDTFAGAQDLHPPVVLGAIGNGGCPDSDFYALSANAGDSLILTTATPSDGPGEFVNTLDPGIQLYDPSGTLVASGVVAPDGRNESIVTTALVSGLYRARIFGQAGSTGEYVLLLLGNTEFPPTPFTPSAATPSCSALTAASPAHLWIGLKSSDDQGTNFDVDVEILKGGGVVASGLLRCVTGVTRNPTLAKEVVVPFDSFSSVPLASGDVLSFNVFTRVGTNPDGTKCGGHNNAQGLRLYYDSTNRPSRFDATITPDSSKDFYLHSDGTVCGSAQSSGVTTRFLDNNAPTASNPRCKDSGTVNFLGGNPFSLIGTWSLAPLP